MPPSTTLRSTRPASAIHASRFTLVRLIAADPEAIHDAASLFQLACDVFSGGHYRVLQ